MSTEEWVNPHVKKIAKKTKYLKQKKARIAQLEEERIKKEKELAYLGSYAHFCKTVSAQIEDFNRHNKFQWVCEFSQIIFDKHKFITFTCPKITFSNHPLQPEHTKTYLAHEPGAYGFDHNQLLDCIVDYRKHVLATLQLEQYSHATLQFKELTWFLYEGRIYWHVSWF